MVLTNQKRNLIYLSGILFSVANMALIMLDFYWLVALPLALGVALLVFFRLDALILLLVLLTPFTIKYAHPTLGFTVDVPTEPVIVAVMCLFFFKLILEREVDLRAFKHPVSVILILQLFWMLLTSVTSEIPLVSLKYFFSRLWFVTAFYFLGLYMFRDGRRMHHFMWLFGLALLMVVIRTTVLHQMHDFDRRFGWWVVRPFFSDHTHYGAVLALVAPFFAVMVFNRSYRMSIRRLSGLLFLAFSLGILFSYSRAAWLSVMMAGGGFLILALRIPFRAIVAGMLLLGSGLLVFQSELVMQMERNTQASSGQFSEHLRSVTNITTDASNLERINRWRSAVRMYQERPVLGWGPGTYQFVYAPFQRSEDYTVITTHFGDVGNAHSEYLGPLAESGLPGMLLFLALTLAVLRTGVQLWKRAPDRQKRLMALGITLGFMTYFMHALLNNFLDTDKASVPFWGMMAMLVAMDVYHASGAKRTKTD